MHTHIPYNTRMHTRHITCTLSAQSTITGITLSSARTKKFREAFLETFLPCGKANNQNVQRAIERRSTTTETTSSVGPNVISVVFLSNVSVGSTKIIISVIRSIVGLILHCIVLYGIVSIHLYSASCTAHQSEAFRSVAKTFENVMLIFSCVKFISSA